MCPFSNQYTIEQTLLNGAKRLNLSRLTFKYLIRNVLSSRKSQHMVDFCFLHQYIVFFMEGKGGPISVDQT